MPLSVITAIPYVDKIYCTAILGTRVLHKQKRLDHSNIREININYNRRDLQELIKKDYFSADLVLLMDSDVLATQEQLDKLLESFDGVPLALRTKPVSSDTHICCACCLISMADYLKIDYVGTYIDECQCKKIMRLFPVKYLDGEQAHEYREYAVHTNMFHGDIVPEYSLRANAEFLTE